MRKLEYKWAEKSWLVKDGFGFDGNVWWILIPDSSVLLNWTLL